MVEQINYNVVNYNHVSTVLQNQPNDKMIASNTNQMVHFFFLT